MILKNARNFASLISMSENTSCLKKGVCFNCAISNKHISKHCDKGALQCKICGKKHVTVLHDPSRPANNASQTSSACIQVCNEGPRRSCATIILLKVTDQLDPGKETNAVLDDQSTDVFVTDALLNELNVSGVRRVSGLQIQDINGEHAPVKVPYAYAQPNIPATHRDNATPNIARQWDHLKNVADKIHHRPDVAVCRLEVTYPLPSSP